MYESTPSPVTTGNKTGRTIILAVILSLIANLGLTYTLGNYYGFIPKSGDGSIVGQKDATKTDAKQAAQTYKSALSDESAVIEVVKKVSPAVVSIVITQDLSKLHQNNPFGNDPLFQQFFGNMNNGQQEIGGGSGFIVSSDGLILTNRHVVEDQTANYTVLLTNEKKMPAKVVAIDQFNDIALLRIEGKNLPTVTIGDSDTIQIGQTVIAIGNALGEYRNTVSTGVVSGLARSIEAGSDFGSTETLTGVIQTDAAINQGNSGGPLLNLKGEVIGMNTAIVQGAQNIGFSIPINDAKKDIESVKKHNKIIRPILGIRYVMNNATIAANNNLSVDYGAIVIRGSTPQDLAVISGGPADKAGIVESDIILEINGIKVTEQNPLPSVLQKYDVGDEIKIKLLHDGKEKTVTVKLEAGP